MSKTRNGRQTRRANRTAQCIAFANHKGGTGKTTSCLSIAGFLAKSGCKVLVVDFDPQANATSGLGIDKMKLAHSVYDAVLDLTDGYQGVPLTQVIVETDVENLHLAPAEFDLAVAERFLAQSRNRTSVLARILERVRAFYDFILIDLPPASGLLTINGLCAADHVVVPVEPSIFALEALDDLKKTLHDVHENTGHTIQHLVAVLIRHVRTGSRQGNPSREIESSLRDMFDTVFVVPAADEIYQTQKVGMPISHYAPQSGAGKAYARIARNILDRAAKTSRLSHS